MGVAVSGSYLGNKKLRVVHEPSGASFITAAPIDNQGDGSSFSPTDLVGVALGSCMLTIMGIYAERNEIDLSGSSFVAEKEMAANPRRIGRLRLEIVVPATVEVSKRQALENAARTCPVHASLGDETEVELRFVYK